MKDTTMDMITSGVEIKNKDTGDVIEIPATDIDWYVSSSIERDMGAERIWEAHVFHEDLGDISWEVSEYPEGFLGEIISNLNGHEPINSISLSLSFDADESDYEDLEILYNVDSLGDVYDLAEKLSSAIPLNEELLFDTKNLAFEIQPEPVKNKNLLNSSIPRISDAVDDVLKGPSNGLNEDSWSIRIIRRAIANYKDDPQRLEMDFTSSHKSLSSQILKDVIPPTEETNELVSALHDTALGIRHAHPDISKNRAMLDSQSIRELTPDEKLILSKSEDVLEAITKGDLKEQFNEGIAALTRARNHKSLSGVTENDAIIRDRDEAIRVFGRSARILLKIKETPNIIIKIDASSAYKSYGILKALGELVKIGWDLFKEYLQ